MVLVEIESLYNRYVSSTVIEYAKPKRERERERVEMCLKITMNKYTKGFNK